MSKERRIMNALGGVDERFIIESSPANTSIKKKPVWMKWGAMGACLAFVAILGVGLFQSGLFVNRTDLATLNNGAEIVFEQSDTLGGALSLAFEATTKPLTETETEKVFGDLPITANAIIKNSDVNEGTLQELIGFEGRIDNVKAVISTSDVQLIDTVIVGTEETSEINGVSINAGYFITDPNSKGEQEAIYYATFELGSCKVYLENAGPKVNSETIKNQLAEVIQLLIDNGEPDFTSFDY